MSENVTAAVSEAAPNSKTKITTKDPALKLAHKRLTVLQLAESLGNVSEACRRGGLDRTSFYEYKRRFQTHGIEGLKDLPPIHKTHPQTTPPEAVEKVVALSLANPTRGCVWLSDKLKLEGVSVSSPTVQDILIKHGMGKRYERVLEGMGLIVLHSGQRATPYRAPGGSNAAFASESVIDELCEKLGIDPLEFRSINGAQEGDRRADGPAYPRIGYRETVEAARQHPHYAAPLKANQGRGVASGFWFNYGGKSSASASVNADGTVSLVEGSPDIGGLARVDRDAVG